MGTFIADGVVYDTTVDGVTPWNAARANATRTALLDLRAVISPVVNAKTQFNAGGTADDTAAVQAALTAGAGKVVYFPAGVYTVDVHPPTLGAATWLKVASGTTIIGDGDATIFRVLASSGSYSCVFSADGANQWTATTDVRFYDFCIDQNPANNVFSITDGVLGDVAAGIYFNNVDGIKVERVKFLTSGVQAIALAGYGYNKNILISDCAFIFTHQGSTDYDNSAIYVDGQNFKVKDNTFIDTAMRYARGAVEVHGGPGVVTGNLSIGYRDGCNVCRTETSDWVDVAIVGNTFAKCGRGIALQPMFNASDIFNGLVVEGNMISLNNVDRYLGAAASPGYPYPEGISFVKGPSWPGAFENISIKNNVIVAQPDVAGASNVDLDVAAITVRCAGAVRSSKIEGNIIRNHPSIGIRFYPEGGARAVDITNNLIVDCGNDATLHTYERHALYAYGTLTDVNIESNTIADTAGTFGGYGGIVIPAGGTWTRVNVRRNAIGASFTNDIPATVNTDLVAHADVASDITLPNLVTNYNALLGRLRAAGVVQ